MATNNIKTIIISTIGAAIVIHGVVDKIFFLDQSDHPSDFSGGFYVLNMTGTTTAFYVLLPYTFIEVHDGFNL